MYLSLISLCPQDGCVNRALSLTDREVAARIVQVIHDETLDGSNALQRSEQPLKNELIGKLYANYGASVPAQLVQGPFVSIQLTLRLRQQRSGLEFLPATLGVSQESPRVVQIQLEEAVRQFVPRQCLSSSLIER